MTEKLSKREKTRQKMLQAAGRSFRRNGYAGIGVDGIAQAAGVTSGAFYAHFGSKDGAFTAALEQGLDEVIDAIPVFRTEHGSQWVIAFAAYYLGLDHRNDLESGCAMTTLSPEVARSEIGVHLTYEKKMRVIADLIADGLEKSVDLHEPDNRHARAWAMLATLIGGLTVSRAVADLDLANMIAASVQRAAIEAAGDATPVGIL